MSVEDRQSAEVRPAKLSFLAIYNPTLGSTDESVRDQIVFHSSRTTRLRKARNGHGLDISGSQDEEENENLRQVGLAQGMVNFAKNFSAGQPVNSIDTQRSRIILHELEPSWWILASTDFTRLPASKLSTHKETSAEEQFEYSSREVAPPRLLLNQLLRAHSIFLLHHGTSLNDLYKRSSRDVFCELLGSFWSRYIRKWNVLLHGNPAVDIYNGIKLAAGGELGIGVGEEEWGSGEREVLEDFVSRTEGLVDLLVSRFGDSPTDLNDEQQTSSLEASQARHDPWLGTDSDPRSSDGMLFSGVGAISRRSIATMSQWVEWIYKYGESAYGVGENPSSRHRKRRKQPPARPTHLQQGSSAHRKHTSENNISSPPNQPHTLRREAVDRGVAGPNIPPPIVGAVESSLAKATSKLISQEVVTNSTDKRNEDAVTLEDSGPFAADKMMRILSLGYGSSWTLSPKGLPDNHLSTTKPSIPAPSAEHKDEGHAMKKVPAEDSVTLDALQLEEVEPKPATSDEEDTPFVQRLEQSIGRFIIGLSGDLENTELIDDEPNNDISSPQIAQRVFLRTLVLEVADTPAQLTRSSHEEDFCSAPGSSGQRTNKKANTNESVPGGGKYQKFQVAVYVHQPFIFAFLFALHTPMLTFPSFYRKIHHQLGPLQRPLLKSTDPKKVAQRIADAVDERSSTTTPATKEGPDNHETELHAIYDIIFDPEKLTVRTSIPNIPLPGTAAAEGLNPFPTNSVTVSGSWYTLGIPISSSPSVAYHRLGTGIEKNQWTRVDALSVHTQILSTWSATHDTYGIEGRAEQERTVKTARGWWILWMRIPSTSHKGIDNSKEAFLVRKATDFAASAKRRDASSAATGSRWLLRDQTRDISGSSTGSRMGGTTTAGMSEGVGVDARKWIDGLLSLNR